jgi:hypothetical protein
MTSSVSAAMQHNLAGLAQLRKHETDNPGIVTPLAQIGPSASSMSSCSAASRAPNYNHIPDSTSQRRPSVCWLAGNASLLCRQQIIRGVQDALNQPAPV